MRGQNCWILERCDCNINKDATKEIWKKLKQLEHNLHVNNVNNTAPNHLNNNNNTLENTNSIYSLNNNENLLFFFLLINNKILHENNNMSLTLTITHGALN